MTATVETADSDRSAGLDRGYSTMMSPLHRRIRLLMHRRSEWLALDWLTVLIKYGILLLLLLMIGRTAAQHSVRTLENAGHTDFLASDWIGAVHCLILCTLYSPVLYSALQYSTVHTLGTHSFSPHTL